MSYNVHRYFEPGTGRYSQRDPLGRRGDLYPYSYVRSRPTFFVGPLGLVTDKKDCACCNETQKWSEHKRAGLFLLNYWNYYAWTPARQDSVEEAVLLRQ